VDEDARDGTDACGADDDDGGGGDGDDARRTRGGPWDDDGEAGRGERDRAGPRGKEAVVRRRWCERWRCERRVDEEFGGEV